MINQFMKEIEKKKVIELNEKDQLGGGQNGNVYLCRINNSTSVAVKCFKDKNAAMQEKKIYEDIQNLAQNFPGIIGYYGMLQIQIKIKGTFDQNYQGQAIFLQVCEGDFSKVVGQVILPIREIFNILSQLILPLLCLHRNGCFHGDIKPANILINSMTINQNKQYSYYLADFGEGKYTGIDISTNYETLTLRGTPYYFAPELYLIHSQQLPKGHYNPLKADIYALGIIILQLLLGQGFIFRLNNERLNQSKYYAVTNTMEQELYKKYIEFQNDPSLLKTLMGMVNYEPRDRPSAIQICSQLILSRQLEISNIQPINLKVLVEWLILQLSQENTITQQSQTSKEIEQKLKEQIVNQEQLQETIKNYEDLIKDLEKKIQEKENIIDRITKAKDEFNKGIEFKDKKMWKEALKYFTDCVQADRQHQKGWFKKGSCEHQLRNYQDAIESYDQALQIDPKDSLAWNNKGAALNNLGKYEEAVKCYDQALQIDPKDSFAWNNKGFALNNLVKYEEVVKCYDQALQIDPKDSLAWNNKGAALNSLGKYEEALKCCKEALLINPKYGNALTNKGIALNELSRYREALECLNQAIIIQPTHMMYFHLGNSYIGLGKKKEALESYKKCEKIDSNFPYVKEKIKQLENK